MGKVVVPEGVPGKLSVVQIGKAGDGSGIPVVVRNRTDKTLSRMEVTGTARTAAGKLAGSGSSQGFMPANVKPGEWAFGYVYFSIDKLPPSTKFDFTATGRETDGEAAGMFDFVDLKVQELEVGNGSFGKEVVGILSNPTEDDLSSPSVLLMCFDAGKPTSTHNGSAETGVTAKGTTSFTVGFLPAKGCTAFAVGASAYKS